jgi:hypothetical protein
MKVLDDGLGKMEQAAGGKPEKRSWMRDECRPVEYMLFAPAVRWKFRVLEKFI